MTTISVSGISGRVLVSVVDINGRVINVIRADTGVCPYDCSNEFTNTLSVENLPHGAYFVRVTGENANVVKKLIVNKIYQSNLNSF